MKKLNVYDLKTFDDFLNCEYYQNYSSETLLDPQFNMINKYTYNVDVDQQIECISEGMFGVTHGQRISNMIDCLNDMYADRKITSKLHDKFLVRCNKVYKWHEKNKSLDELT